MLSSNFVFYVKPNLIGQLLLLLSILNTGSIYCHTFHKVDIPANYGSNSWSSSYLFIQFLAMCHYCTPDFKPLDFLHQDSLGFKYTKTACHYFVISDVPSNKKLHRICSSSITAWLSPLMSCRSFFLFKS